MNWIATSGRRFLHIAVKESSPIGRHHRRDWQKGEDFENHPEAEGGSNGERRKPGFGEGLAEEPRQKQRWAEHLKGRAA